MNEFENYMLDKIDKSFFPQEREMNEAILALYKKGYLNVKMDGDKPMLSVSEEGENVYTHMLLASMTPVGEA